MSVSFNKLLLGSWLVDSNFKWHPPPISLSMFFSGMTHQIWESIRFSYSNICTFSCKWAIVQRLWQKQFLIWNIWESCIHAVSMEISIQNTNSYLIFRALFCNAVAFLMQKICNGWISTVLFLNNLQTHSQWRRKFKENFGKFCDAPKYFKYVRSLKTLRN